MSTTLDAYWHTIRDTEPVSREREAALRRAARDGDLEARNALVTANLRYAVDVACAIAPFVPDLCACVRVLVRAHVRVRAFCAVYAVPCAVLCGACGGAQTRWSRTPPRACGASRCCRATSTSSRAPA